MILHGDCFDVLKTLDANSIDACVTDPPYGIGFMGREWDTFKPGAEAARIVPNRAKDSENPNLKGRTRGPASSPSAVEYNRSIEGQREFQTWCERWAREVFRVLKPGAHLIICGAPRSFHRMTCGVEDAGFEIRDCLSWLYGQGFPKSLNVGEGRGTALKPSWEPCVLGRKPFKGNLVRNLAAHGTGALNVDACRIDGAKPDTTRGAGGQNGRYGPIGAQGRILDDGLGPRARDESRKEGGPGGDNPRNRGLQPRGNFHPTVKPVELMRWLVRLVTPIGGTVAGQRLRRSADDDQQGRTAGLAITDKPRLEGTVGAELARSGHGRSDADTARPAFGDPRFWPARPGEQQHGWEPPRCLESSVGRRADGVSRGLAGWRRAALQAFGNAVVPQVAEVVARRVRELMEF